MSTERVKIPFNGWLRFATDGDFKLDVVKLSTFHVFRLLQDFRHLFLGCKLQTQDFIPTSEKKFNRKFYLSFQQ